MSMETALKSDISHIIQDNDGLSTDAFTTVAVFLMYVLYYYIDHNCTLSVLKCSGMRTRRLIPFGNHIYSYYQEVLMLQVQHMPFQCLF